MQSETTPILLWDNKPKSLCEIDEESDISILRKLCGKSLADLSRSGQILCIPEQRSDELVSTTPILSMDGETVMAGNIVGFVGDEQSLLIIKSKFDSSTTDFFVQYMLCRVLGLNVAQFSTYSSTYGVFDLLPFLFPVYLKRALRQGIYRPYVEVDYNGQKPKGKIDIAAQIRRNMPFRGAMAYNFRERKEDNFLTQLVRHTIEILSEDKISSRVLSMDRETTNAVRCIREFTPSYNKRDLRKVMRDNQRPFSHPYFTHYAPLQKLCRMIIRRRKAGYDQCSLKVNGMLVDVAWLWEEYLNEVLKAANVQHPRNRIKKGAVYVAGSVKLHSDMNPRSVQIWERYPDFFTDDCVLDAKYKNISRDDVSRDDVHQLIAYMHIMNRNYGALISPTTMPNNEYDIFGLNGVGGKMALLRMAVPQNCSSFSDFCSAIRNSEMGLLDFVVNRMTGSQLG